MSPDPADAALCPSTGMTCVDEMRGRLQAIADQAMGVHAAVHSRLIDGRSDTMLFHYETLAKLILAALDDYARDHGPVPVLMDVSGVQWLLERLVS